MTDRIPVSEFDGAVVAVIAVGTIAERDALTQVGAGDVAVVQDRGDGERQAFIYNGTEWLAFAEVEDA